MTGRRKKTKSSGLKPLLKQGAKKSVQLSTPPATEERYVQEIKNILKLLIQNKNSEPFRVVPPLSQYRSLIQNPVCLTTMQEKAAQSPCGYPSFKQFDTEMTLLHRQEMRFDAKYSTAISSGRKRKMEILKTYYATLSRSILAHGPRLSPNHPASGMRGQPKPKTPGVPSSSPPRRMRRVKQTPDVSGGSQGPAQKRAGSMLKTPEYSTSLINLSTPTPPPPEPQKRPSAQAPTTVGRKRLLFARDEEETKMRDEGQPPKKRLRLAPRTSPPGVGYQTRQKEGKRTSAQRDESDAVTVADDGQPSTGSRQRARATDDRDVEMKETDEGGNDADMGDVGKTAPREEFSYQNMLLWKRFELIVDVRDPKKGTWTRETVHRAGFDLESVVQKFYAVHPGVSMKMVSAHFSAELTLEDVEGC